MSILRKILVVFVIRALVTNGPEFYSYCTEQMAVGLSHPSLMFQARLNDGSVVMVDDYREAYWWLRDHTPKDARVMAWWDYGYQITGIGNRTTIADGNTWNHEHIALLGRCLTSPEEKAHKIVKHLADYVLIWAGGGGDDLAKSPHMARIGNSVFEDICPGDPTCSQFGFRDRQMTPTPMMEASLLYRLHQNRLNPMVNVDPTLFKEVFFSKFGKVRIYQVMGVSKKSKSWAADPVNRKCDAPGSWYCTGNYPPALNKTLEKRKSFRQLEDFNVKADDKAKKYYEEYMKRMSGQGGGARPPQSQVTSGDADGDMDEAEPPETLDVSVRYVGCYGGETAFVDRQYFGGSAGAYFQDAAYNAQSTGKKFFAIARGGEEGHSFVFSKLSSTKGKMKGGGCDRPCLDDEERSCGCMDDACTGKTPKGEEHNRRWAVYEIV